MKAPVNLSWVYHEINNNSGTVYSRNDSHNFRPNVSFWDFVDLMKNALSLDEKSEDKKLIANFQKEMLAAKIPQELTQYLIINYILFIYLYLNYLITMNNNSSLADNHTIFSS